MRRILRSQWLKFQSYIEEMGIDSSPREILHVILSWLRRYPSIFLDEPFATYSFDRFLMLDEYGYPAETSTMHGSEFLHFKKIIKKYAASDSESIARFLRDTLESLIVMELDRQCSRCDCWGMKVYKNKHDGRTALECRQCGFAIYADGSRVGADKLIFAVKDDLHRAGFD